MKTFIIYPIGNFHNSYIKTTKPNDYEFAIKKFAKTLNQTAIIGKHITDNGNCPYTEFQIGEQKYWCFKRP